MSGSAAIAAAHKRRAQAQPSQDKAFSRYRPTAKTNSRAVEQEDHPEVEIVHVKDVLRLVFARLASLKSDLTTNDQHWTDHDALVKQICQSVDALSGRVDALEAKLGASAEE